MNLPGQLNPPPRLILRPGPSHAHPRALSAMATPLLGHLDPAFLDLMQDTQQVLRDAYLTKNPLTFPISATGMAGMEACVVNLVEPGDKVVVCAKGFFGQRMIDVAGRAGAQVTALEQGWSEVFELNRLTSTVTQARSGVVGVATAT